MKIISSETLSVILDSAQECRELNFKTRLSESPGMQRVRNCIQIDSRYPKETLLRLGVLPFETNYIRHQHEIPLSSEQKDLFGAVWELLKPLGDNHYLDEFPGSDFVFPFFVILQRMRPCLVS